MTYLSSFSKIQVLRKVMKFTSLVRKISAKANAKIEKPAYKRKNKNAYWISPPLTAVRIQNIKSVTGIVTGLSYVSWVKMSVPELNLLDWNLKILPLNFLNQIDESNIVTLAYDVKDSLPDSDIYVMESIPLRECRHHGSVNKLQLSSMITVLLNGFNRDSAWKEKVIFQKKFVMNYLYDIQIASERISTRSVVENILLKSTFLADCDLVDDSFSKSSAVSIDHSCLENFKQLSLDKQEDLSLAFLLTLSFINPATHKGIRTLMNMCHPFSAIFNKLCLCTIHEKLLQAPKQVEQMDVMQENKTKN